MQLYFLQLIANYPCNKKVCKGHHDPASCIHNHNPRNIHFHSRNNNHRSGPMLIVHPTVELAKKFSKQRLEDLITETEVIERISQNNLIIELEKTTNYVEGKLVKSIAIYELNDNRISKIWFGGRTLE